MPLGAHSYLANSAYFGSPKALRKPGPHEFLKKDSSLFKLPSITEATSPYSKYKYTQRKPQVPRHDESPVLGLNTNKNFLSTNLIDVVLTEPKESPREVDWTKKEVLRRDTAIFADNEEGVRGGVCSL